MKLVYISNSTIPSRAANSIHVMKMCHALASNGHSVTLLAPNKKEGCEKGIEDLYDYYGVTDSFNIIKLSWMKIKFINNLYYALCSLFFLFKYRPDYVHGRDLYACLFSSFFFSTSYEIHNLPNGRVKRTVLKIMINRRKFMHLVVISDALKVALHSMKGFGCAEILVAHDAADEPKIHWATKLKGNEGAIKVGYVGNLYQGKGIEVIESIAGRVNNNIEFHIIGGFPEDLSYWEKRIKCDNVFFYGFVPQSDLQPYMNALDICLLPNKKVVMPHGEHRLSANISEYTSPLKMFEYMASRKAIVASNLPVLKEVLNAENSVLCDPDIPEEWIKEIAVLAENDEARARLAEKAYGDFINNFTWLRRAQLIVGNFK